MARIRSVHPGFFTDEHLVSVSMAARLLFLGLGVEADDKGVFEWKPLTLKMRIFPGDNIDVVALLAELEEVEAIRRYEIDGRKYGAIRNFRKFQKPKTPNDIHPIPDDFRNFVGLPSSTSAPLTKKGEAFPQKGENSPQMEDGGWRMETALLSSDEESSSSSEPPPLEIDEKEIGRRLEQATGWKDLRHVGAIADLVRGGMDFEDRILPLARETAAEFRASGRDPPKTWGYFAKVAQDESRKPPASEKPVEMVFVPESSGHWKALCAIKQESYLRQMLKTAGDGTQGVYWPKRDLPSPDCREAAE